MFIIDTKETSTGGYNVYSNGYYEEWGQTGAFTNAYINITLSKTMKDTSYIVLATSWGWIQAPSQYICLGLKTKTSFETRASTALSMNAQWKVSGFLAEGQYNSNYKQIIKY